MSPRAWLEIKTIGEQPPDETALLVVKPEIVTSQVMIIALVETAFLSIGSSLTVFTLVFGVAWFLESPEFLLPPPWAMGLAAALAWMTVHLIVGGLFGRYRKYAAMAPKMEYRFYENRFAYTVGDGNWCEMPYDLLKEATLKPAAKKSATGHIDLTYNTGKEVLFAARRMPSIPHAESVCNNINRLLGKFHATGKTAAAE